MASTEAFYPSNVSNGLLSSFHFVSHASRWKGRECPVVTWSKSEDVLLEYTLCWNANNDFLILSIFTLDRMPSLLHINRHPWSGMIVSFTNACLLQIRDIRSVLGNHEWWDWRYKWYTTVTFTRLLTRLSESCVYAGDGGDLSKWESGILNSAREMLNSWGYLRFVYQ